MFYGILADILLILHLGFALFIAAGLFTIYIGGYAGWTFVRNPTFRLVHLGAMGIVLLESLAGWFCPLTRWEYLLRELAGNASDTTRSFMQYWAERFFYFQWDESTFTLLYAFTFGAILAGLVFVPIKRKRTKGN